MDEGLVLELLVDILEVDVDLVHVEDAFRMPRFSRSVETIRKIKAKLKSLTAMNVKFEKKTSKETDQDCPTPRHH